MDGAKQALVAAVGAMPPQELDLQVVQRIEIRKAIADGARERGVVGEQLEIGRASCRERV